MKLNRNPLVEIELGIQGDTAASLGQAGRKLEHAMKALRGSASREHTQRLFAAADALWAYVVQREAVGLTDNRDVSDTYDIPHEVWRIVGATPH